MVKSSGDYNISLAAGADLDEIARLFRAYAAKSQVDLRFQKFEEELAELPCKYAKR
ncbi:MAG: hypothetical protein ACOC29_01160 [Candidatus Sumerlaeota bacterium]